MTPGNVVPCEHFRGDPDFLAIPGLFYTIPAVILILMRTILLEELDAIEKNIRCANR